ncbi:6-bladed beta-propeller [Proteiniphilum acetatigenes]|uniref:6-bladed beta-propeller n=1 Tax=Proteiniphilum acetatigenes TaxID=294710 RepID=UPI000377AC2B|nr:6-bladed beta-propeller [Proteiniphilum acetatigenes]
MMKENILFIVFCLFLNVCHRKIIINEGKIIKSGEMEIIKLMDAPTNTSIDISPFLDTIKYVKLELTEESIIGYIQKLTVYEDRIYILDTQTSPLFVFNINGEYLFKISNVGQGPKEYSQLDFFDIDFKNKQIVLTDLMGYWIMKYDLDGHFINRKKIPFWIEGIVPCHDNGYAIYANYRKNKTTMKKEYNLMYLDSLMNITKV